jgi:nucleotide-binding universal stress UspA family protein
MQQILIPTDFSENAWNATLYALGFFKSKCITFHFLHVDISLKVEPDNTLHYSGLSINKGISDETKTEMQLWIKKLEDCQKNSNYTFKNTINQGPFINSIRKYIQKNNIQLMVMGTKGASGLKEMTIGSKTGEVIKKIKCPILIIPEEARFKAPLHIGFPTDFNMLYKHRIMKTLLDITNVYQSSIKILRVAQTKQPLDNFQNNNRDLLKYQIGSIPHSFHLIENPYLENALQSFVTTMHIDMIAMIAKNLNFFQRILFKPQLATISYHIQIPFLILHE